MSGRSQRVTERQEDGEPARSRPPAPLAPGADILALQRGAGNAAVARLISGGGGAQVSRLAGTPAATPGLEAAVQALGAAIDALSGGGAGFRPLMKAEAALQSAVAARATGRRPRTGLDDALEAALAAVRNGRSTALRGGSAASGPLAATVGALTVAHRSLAGLVPAPAVAPAPAPEAQPAPPADIYSAVEEARDDDGSEAPWSRAADDDVYSAVEQAGDDDDGVEMYGAVTPEGRGEVVDDGVEMYGAVTPEGRGEAGPIVDAPLPAPESGGGTGTAYDLVHEVCVDLRAIVIKRIHRDATATADGVKVIAKAVAAQGAVKALAKQLKRAGAEEATVDAVKAAAKLIAKVADANPGSLESSKPTGFDMSDLLKSAFNARRVIADALKTGPQLDASQLAAPAPAAPPEPEGEIRSDGSYLPVQQEDAVEPAAVADHLPDDRERPAEAAYSSTTSVPDYVPELRGPAETAHSTTSVPDYTPEHREPEVQAEGSYLPVQAEAEPAAAPDTPRAATDQAVEALNDALDAMAAGDDAEAFRAVARAESAVGTALALYEQGGWFGEIRKWGAIKDDFADVRTAVLDLTADRDERERVAGQLENLLTLCGGHRRSDEPAESDPYAQIEESATVSALDYNPAAQAVVEDAPAIVPTPESLDQLAGRPMLVAELLGGDTKYFDQLKTRDQKQRQDVYEHEFENAEATLLWLMLSLEKSVSEQGMTLEKAMAHHFGWDAGDYQRYMATAGSHIAVADAEPNSADFMLELGSTIKRGGKAFSTLEMFSKFKGAGFAIFVMDGGGRFYADRHKVSLFHHSSFLGGADVSGAGEMRVADGKLTHITNKSGHYFPGFEEMADALMRLAAADVGLDGVEVTVIWPGNSNGVVYPKKAADFLRDFKSGGPDHCQAVAEGEATRVRAKNERKKREAATA